MHHWSFDQLVFVRFGSLADIAACADLCLLHNSKRTNLACMSGVSAYGTD